MGHKTLYYAVRIRSLFHTPIAFPQEERRAGIPLRKSPPRTSASLIPHTSTRKSSIHHHIPFILSTPPNPRQIQTYSLNCALNPTHSLFTRPFSLFNLPTSSWLSLNFLFISSTPSPPLTAFKIFPSSSLNRAYNASFSPLASRYNSSNFLHLFSETVNEEERSEEMCSMRDFNSSI